MRKFYSLFLPVIVLFLSQKPQILACGYDWIGDCSSAVHLRINGTLDSFDIADCPAGLRFQGQYLGNLQHLSLANARAITWESCINNVTAVGLKYRVYEQGGAAGGYQILNLDQDYFTLLGPYTTRYRSKASNIDLTAGLVVGKTYILEVYFVAEVDTIGDDFIPETTITRNNGGQNYQLTFTYGGAQAPPFVVIPTRVIPPNCHGESNGVIGVSVWGDQTGLFYQWSNINLNFYQQNNLSAGTYTVTVTGSNYSEASTIQLIEPDTLILQTTDLQPVSCSGGLGSVTLVPGGGTAPYHYAWQNGQTTAIATFQTSGNYTVSVTDAHNCQLVQTIQIPGTGLIQEDRNYTLCMGQSIMIGSTLIDKGGVYEIQLPGSGGCDTLLHVTVTAYNPGALLASLPANILITCANPSVNLCADSSPGVSYQWSKDGVPATQTPCLLATAGGIYTQTVQLNGCIATKMIHSKEHLTPPVFTAGGTVGYIMDCYVVDSIILTCSASFAGPGAHFEWTLQGQTVSISDTCVLHFDGDPSQLLSPLVTVTDQYGCHATKQPIVGILPPPMAPFIEVISFQADWCTGLEEVDYSIWGGNGNFIVTWNDSISTGDKVQLAAGTYLVKMVDTEGCTTEQVVPVPSIFNATVTDSPFPNMHTGSIHIETSGPAHFLWDNGSVNSNRYDLAPGEYCVNISDWENNCSLDTCFFVGGMVRTTEQSGSALRILPNPVTSGAWLKIELPADFAAPINQVELTDIQGNKVMAAEIVLMDGSLLFKLSTSIIPGMYLIHISNEFGQSIGKVCVQK